MSTDIYLCPNTGFGPTDIILRTATACTGAAVDESGGSPGAYILGGGYPTRPPRKTKKKATPDWFKVEMYVQAARHRREAEDDLLLADLI